jgi:ferredoxin
MPRVRFVTPAGEVEADAPEGGRLLDLCDEVCAPIRFACRSASCGTCVAVVTSGAEHLEPPDEDERHTLEHLGETADSRLVCVARLRRESGLVVLLVVA